MADREGFSKFFGLRPAQLPQSPDELENPKRKVVDLMQKSTKIRKRALMVPKPGFHVPVGPGYETLMREFVSEHWDPVKAARHSDSLRRARKALAEMSAWWSNFIEAS